MAIFNSYVCLPECSSPVALPFPFSLAQSAARGAVAFEIPRTQLFFVGWNHILLSNSNLWPMISPSAWNIHLSPMNYLTIHYSSVPESLQGVHLTLARVSIAIGLVLFKDPAFAMESTREIHGNAQFLPWDTLGTWKSAWLVLVSTPRNMSQLGLRSSQLNGKKKMFPATNQKSNGNIYTSLIGSNKFYGDMMAIHGGNSIIRINQVSITYL